MSFQQPPLQTPFFDNRNGQISVPWQRYFQEISRVLAPGTAVSGSRSGGAALDNLLDTLDEQGVITNETTA